MPISVTSNFMFCWFSGIFLIATCDVRRNGKERGEEKGRRENGIKRLG